MSKIRVVEIGWSRYEVGKTYRGLRLAQIKVVEHEGEIPGFQLNVTGYTENEEIVFDILNCPTHIEYEAESVEKGEE